MSFSCEKIRKARKEHKCLSCGSKIQKDEEYLYVSWSVDGTVIHWKLCRFCANLTSRFDAETEYDYYQIWDEAENLGIIDINHNEKTYWCSRYFGDEWCKKSRFYGHIASFNRNENNDPFIVKGGNR